MKYFYTETGYFLKSINTWIPVLNDFSLLDLINLFDLSFDGFWKVIPHWLEWLTLRIELKSCVSIVEDEENGFLPNSFPQRETVWGHKLKLGSVCDTFESGDGVWRTARSAPREYPMDNASAWPFGRSSEVCGRPRSVRRPQPRRKCQVGWPATTPLHRLLTLT